MKRSARRETEPTVDREQKYPCPYGSSLCSCHLSNGVWEATTFTRVAIRWPGCSNSAAPRRQTKQKGIQPVLQPNSAVHQVTSGGPTREPALPICATSPLNGLTCCSGTTSVRDANTHDGTSALSMITATAAPTPIVGWSEARKKTEPAAAEPTKASVKIDR